MELARYWEMGGWWMYPILLAGMVAVPAAVALPVIAFASGQRTVARASPYVLLAISSLPFALGVLGWQAGLGIMEDAISHVNRADFDAIRMAGRSEARVCLIFGMMAAALPLAVGASLVGISWGSQPVPRSRTLSAVLVGGIVLVAAVGAIGWQIHVRTAEEALSHRGAYLAGDPTADDARPRLRETDEDGPAKSDRQAAEAAEGLGASNPAVMGSLDKNVVRTVIGRHTREIRFCYEAELGRRPSLAGKLTVKFVIGANGSVQTAKVDTSTLGNPGMEACILARVRSWSFPQPAGGGLVVVSYPFVFKPAGDGSD